MALAFESRRLSTSWLEHARKRRMLLLAILVALGSVGLARFVLAFDAGALAGVVVCLGLVAVLARPRFGLYLMFAIILFFEGSSDDPLMQPGVYLNRSIQETLHVTGGIVIPLELLLMLTAVVWLAHGALRQRLDFRSGAFGRPMMLFGIALAAGIARGLVGGAIFNFTFWESRFLVGMVVSYVLAANLIRTRAHIQTLITLVMVCVGLNGIEGVFRKFALIDTGLLGPAQETWFSHEDVVLWGLLIMLVVAQQVFGAPRWQRILGPVLTLITMFTMLVSERRAGYIAVMVAFLAFALVLLFVKRTAFFLLAVPVLIAGAVYLPLFWNNTGTFGQPARAIRSLSAPDPRDASSNAWRGLEAVNVQATIASDPLLGVGFGRPFLQVVTVPSISFFEFWNYESHHDILWVWMKTGAFGFICFFVLITSGLARSVWLIKSLKDPEYRTFAVLVMSALLMTATFCYVDLGLTSARLPMLLGIALGALGVVERLSNNKQEPSKQPSATSFIKMRTSS